MTRPSSFPIGLLLALALSAPASADSGNTVKVLGGDKELGETPILIELKDSDALSRGELVLRTLQSPDGRPAAPANVFKDGGKRYLGMIVDRVPARAETRFENRLGTSGAAGPGVELIELGRRVEVRVAGKALTTYIPDDGPKPYYFPLNGPSGLPMTRSFPMAKVQGEKYDHPHHRSFWFTHGSVNKVDFWSEAAGHGTIKETSRPTLVSGSAVGVIRTTDDWIGPDGKKVCEDERVVRFYATTKARVIDFEIVLKATAGPVTFGDTKEGMFGLRVPTSMDLTSKRGGKILNAEGITDKSAWGKASPWVDYSGPVGDKTVGVAILNHPASFRYPTTWHVRDYGLFAANPFGWHDFGQKTSGEFTLPAGESIRFAYRIILHDGDATSADLPGAFHAYEAPPKVVIE